MIKHILNDGRSVKSIKGHRVKREECPTVYEIAERKGNQNDLRRFKKSK